MSWGLTVFVGSVLLVLQPSKSTLEHLRDAAFEPAATSLSLRGEISINQIPQSLLVLCTSSLDGSELTQHGQLNMRGTSVKAVSARKHTAAQK